MSKQPGQFLLSAARLRLLHYLIDRPRTPTELSTLENKHLSQVSRTLGELRRMGLVELAESRSRQRYYKPTTDGYLAYGIITRQIK